MAISQEYWNELGKNSILLNAVSNWRDDSELWFSKSVNRLPETVRVNYLRKEWKWVEEWLKNIGAKKIKWFRDTQGSAWTLPFERGKAEGQVKSIISSLHRTGRITRQEAVSMIPTIALEIKPGEFVLDMCSSPGSKATQIAENLQKRGLVIANEIANNRINTLVSNIQRHGNKTSMIIQHDGRHIPKILNPGFDKILVDVPCTGSGTTRKNPDVWKKWLPSGSRSLHNLQVELLRKAINLSKPGGRIVYSTCSLDPVENEAVVAEVLRDNTVEILSPKDILKSIPFDEGFAEWPKLDDSGGEDNDLKLEKSMLPPTEKFIIDSLKKCVRIWNDKIDGSGFFISILEKRIDAMNPDERKNSFLENNITPDPENFPTPINKEIREMIINRFGKCPENLWIRGRKISWTTDEAKTIWKNEKSRKSGRVVIPGNRWRPLKIISLGLSTIKLKNNKIDRIIGKSAQEIIPIIDYGHIILDGKKIDKILIEEFLLNEDFDIDISEHKGGLILIDGRDGTCIPVWIGNKVSLMINDDEKRILRFMKGLDISNREEE